MSDVFSGSSPPKNGRNDSTAGFWHRFEQLKCFEQGKNALIEELLYRYEFLSDEHRKECEDLDREREYNRSVQRTFKARDEEIRRLQNALTRDPFILVLIDGDGMVFQDALLKEAEAGGRKAAGMLHAAVTDYLQNNMGDLPSDVKIVTRIYANVKGLAQACYGAAVIDRIQDIEEFARGFTQGRNLFDFVDVGAGKDRADDKLGELFKLHLRDFRCRQILLGCSHDNGYARVLEEIALDATCINQVTLLEGVPFEKELAALPFKTTKFGNLFRPAKVNQYQQIGTFIEPFPPAPLALRNVAATSNGGSGMPANQRNDSVSTNTSDQLAPPTWAGAASKGAVKPPSPSFTPVKSMRSNESEVPTEVARNRKGQRVDPVPTKYDKDEVNRVKRLKMCNVHFLRRECPYGNDCTHVHNYKPTKAELETLKLVARMAPCQYGSACDDVKCIYGHRCPAPDRKDPSKIGHANGKTCIFGTECRFAGEMHNMDTTVVKMTKV